MEISISKTPRTVMVNESVSKAEFNDMVTSILEGDVFSFSDDRKVSVDEFVSNGDFLFHCHKETVKFLCGNTAVLEQINATLKERIEHDLLNAFIDYDIEVI